MPSVYRILDANANRAREALRVMEDAARFVLDDAELSGQLKQLRHDMAQCLSSFSQLEAWRDTPGDVGTALTTDSEQSRSDVADVVTAAGKRLSEALRVLEEYSKTLPETLANVSASIEKLRYRGYTLEQKLTSAMGTTRARQWKLCVLISESLCPEGDWLRVAEAVVAGGADCIQLREKGLDDRELLTRTRRLVSFCRPKGVAVIINDRPDVALLGEADGVHLGQTDLPCREVRKLVGRQLLIGVSTCSLDQAGQALADGADYCGVGPMFPTMTKHKPVLAGPEYLREYLAWGRLPHLAIGGINPNNIMELVAAGVKGVAVSSAVCSADKPDEITRQMIRALHF
ncbi:MAG: thiamine phosphate synthase [Phycisphaeraceae bacterium]